MKNKNIPKPSDDYSIILNSSYVVLPDQRVAHLVDESKCVIFKDMRAGVILTPTVIRGVKHYNLFIPDYTRLSVHDIAATVEAGKLTKAKAPTA